MVICYRLSSRLYRRDSFVVRLCRRKKASCLEPRDAALEVERPWWREILMKKKEIRVAGGGNSDSDSEEARGKIVEKEVGSMKGSVKLVSNAEKQELESHRS